MLLLGEQFSELQTGAKALIINTIISSAVFWPASDSYAFTVMGIYGSNIACVLVKIDSHLWEGGTISCANLFQTSTMNGGVYFHCYRH